MDIGLVKYFVHIDTLNGVLTITKDFSNLLDMEDYEIGLYGVLSTDNGDTLFEIDFTYENQPFVWRRLMHINSFIGYYRYIKKIFLDKESEKYINNLIKEYYGTLGSKI